MAAPEHSQLCSPKLPAPVEGATGVSRAVGGWGLSMQQQVHSHWVGSSLPPACDRERQANTSVLQLRKVLTLFHWALGEHWLQGHPGVPPRMM